MQTTVWILVFFAFGAVSAAEWGYEGDHGMYRDFIFKC